MASASAEGDEEGFPGHSDSTGAGKGGGQQEAATLWENLGLKFPVFRTDNNSNNNNMKMLN